MIKLNDEVTIDPELEACDVYEFIDSLPLEGSNWDCRDLEAIGFKSYDEDGNSYSSGIIRVSLKGKTQDDLDELLSIIEYEKDNLNS